VKKSPNEYNFFVTNAQGLSLKSLQRFGGEAFFFIVLRRKNILGLMQGRHDREDF